MFWEWVGDLIPSGVGLLLVSQVGFCIGFVMSSLFLSANGIQHNLIVVLSRFCHYLFDSSRGVGWVCRPGGIRSRN